MPRRTGPPRYPRKMHSASGQARIKIKGRHVYLGPFGSPESYARFEEVLRDWRQAQTAPSPPARRSDVRTVADLVDRFWTHATTYYRDRDGKPTSELGNFQSALRVVLRLYADTPRADFGPRCLKAIQRAMADGSWMNAEDRARAEKGGKGRGWSRTHINRACSRIKTFVGWCESEELVPGGTVAAFRTVPPIRSGTSGVREMPDVPPVPERDLQLTLAQMNPIPRALFEVLLLTGARPGELVRLTPADLDRSGEVEVARGYRVKLGASLWAYQPERHKTAYKGHRRVILFGPRAQAILLPFLEGREPARYLFSPRDALEHHRRELRRRRVSRVYSERKRAARPKRPPGDCWTMSALQHVINAAVTRADRADRAAGGTGVAHWTAHQCRHNAATRLVEQFGWEVARTILGHRSFSVTQIYAVDNLKSAADAMDRAG